MTLAERIAHRLIDLESILSLRGQVAEEELLSRVQELLVDSEEVQRFREIILLPPREQKRFMQS